MRPPPTWRRSGISAPAPFTDGASGASGPVPRRRTSGADSSDRPRDRLGRLPPAAEASRRPLIQGFVEFLRLNSVSQEPALVRQTGEWLARAMGARASGLGWARRGGNP